MNPQTNIHSRPVRNATRRPRGSVLAYSMSLMLLSTALVSLAVDYGHMQLVKTQEQRCADAVSRGLLAAVAGRSQLVRANNMTNAEALAYAISVGMDKTIEAANPVDPGSGVAATYDVKIGSWYGSPAQFVWDNGAAGPVAVKVTVSRTTTTGNAVKLAFPIPNGRTLVSKTCDVWATATAMLPNSVTLSNTIQATQDPWLAGMPVDTTHATSDDDYVTTNSVTAASHPSNGYDANSTIAVTPGSTITWNVVNPHLSHLTPPQYYDANGMTGNMYNHLKDGPAGAATYTLGNGGQNGIGDVEAPIDSIIGVFLDSQAPNDPSNTQYANYANANYRPYSTDYNNSSAITGDIHLQQPFFIGNGTNSSAVQRSFVVPENASRLFLGMMDGYEWSNNVGSFAVTYTEQPPIQMVQ